MNSRMIRFVGPLMLIIGLSGILGTIAKSQMEYDAVIRINQIQQQSLDNYTAHQEYREYLASIKE